MKFNFNDEYVIRMLEDYGVIKRREDLPGLIWFDLPPDGGYLVLYDDSREHYHTYRNPENWAVASE